MQYLGRSLSAALSQWNCAEDLTLIRTKDYKAQNAKDAWRNPMTQPSDARKPMSEPTQANNLTPFQNWWVQQRFRNTYTDSIMGACEAAWNASRAERSLAPATPTGPFLWAIEQPEGGMMVNENCIFFREQDAQENADELSCELDDGDAKFTVFPLYRNDLAAQVQTKRSEEH